MHTCIHAYMHTCIHTYIVAIWDDSHTYLWYNPFLCAYIHTYIQTYIHAYIHTHIHTYTGITTRSDPESLSHQAHTIHTYIHTYTGITTPPQRHEVTLNLSLTKHTPSIPQQAPPQNEHPKTRPIPNSRMGTSFSELRRSTNSVHTRTRYADDVMQGNQGARGDSRDGYNQDDRCGRDAQISGVPMYGASGRSKSSCSHASGYECMRLLIYGVCVCVCE